MYTDLIVKSVLLFHVTKWGFSGSKLPNCKFEHRVRRREQKFGKIATTTVLNKDEICFVLFCFDEICFDQGYNDNV